MAVKGETAEFVCSIGKLCSRGQVHNVQVNVRLFRRPAI